MYRKTLNHKQRFVSLLQSCDKLYRLVDISPSDLKKPSLMIVTTNQSCLCHYRLYISLLQICGFWVLTDGLYSLVLSISTKLNLHQRIGLGYKFSSVRKRENPLDVSLWKYECNMSYLLSQICIDLLIKKNYLIK